MLSHCESIETPKLPLINNPISSPIHRETTLTYTERHHPVGIVLIRAHPFPRLLVDATSAKATPSAINKCLCWRIAEKSRRDDWLETFPVEATGSETFSWRLHYLLLLPTSIGILLLC